MVTIFGKDINIADELERFGNCYHLLFARGGSTVKLYKSAFKIFETCDLLSLMIYYLAFPEMLLLLVTA